MTTIKAIGPALELELETRAFHALLNEARFGADRMVRYRVPRANGGGVFMMLGTPSASFRPQFEGQI